MIRILGKIPQDVTVACSGGVDSMAVLDFLRNGKKNVRVAHFNHNTVHASEAEEVVLKYCANHQIPISVGRLSRERPPRRSIEEFWRNERYDFFRTQPGPIVTAHHLGDVMEWWMFTALHGEPKLIPQSREDCDVIRPFLTTSKRDFYRWAHKNSVSYIDDPSNDDDSFMRNHIRNNMMPMALKVNPGFEKTMIKKVEKEFKCEKEA
jgi:tRNA(Ile)-lysidine synthetase-like protein